MCARHVHTDRIPRAKCRITMLSPHLQELTKENVVPVVRVCDPTYDKSKMQAVGIEVHDWPFPDGDPPPDTVIGNWLSLIKSTVLVILFAC